MAKSNPHIHFLADEQMQIDEIGTNENNPIIIDDIEMINTNPESPIIIDDDDTLMTEENEDEDDANLVIRGPYPPVRGPFLPEPLQGPVVPIHEEINLLPRLVIDKIITYSRIAHTQDTPRKKLLNHIRKTEDIRQALAHTMDYLDVQLDHPIPPFLTPSFVKRVDTVQQGLRAAIDTINILRRQPPGPNDIELRLPFRV